MHVSEPVVNATLQVHMVGGFHGKSAGWLLFSLILERTEINATFMLPSQRVRPASVKLLQSNLFDMIPFVRPNVSMVLLY